MEMHKSDNLVPSIPANLSPEQQIRLARLLLLHYGVFHSVLQFQLEKYLVACCNIAIGGEVKLDFAAKMVIFNVYTEKNYKRVKNTFKAIKSSKISDRKYKNERKQAKINLEEWSRRLLWDNETTVRVYIDGREE